jgi:hypothetical protein
VPILVLGVGGLVGNSHREIGQHRCGKVDQGMPSFRQDGERAGQQADNGLRRRQRSRRSDRAKGSLFFIVHRQPFVGSA